MKNKLLMLMALGLAVAAPLAVQADPASDLRQFQGYFKKQFPNVPLKEFSDGFYVLPGFEAYKQQWEAYNDFPPYELGLAEGEKQWKTPFKNGQTFASCFRNGGKDLAQHYPFWDEHTKQIRTVEMDLSDCMKRNGEPGIDFATLNKDGKTRVQLANLTAYFYSMSKGKPVSIDMSKPGAVAAYERGKQYFWAKRGQLNFACADCHVHLAGKNLGGNQPLSAALGHPLGWPAYRLEWRRLDTVMQRYATCNKQVRAKPLKHNSEEYRDLQLYETYMSSGLPLTAPAMRN